MVKHYTIPIFVPHLGCTYDCVFCNQTKITGKSTTANVKEARETIDQYLSYFTKDARLEIGFFGGSFTGIDPKVQEELLGLAQEYKLEGKVQGIRLSTRPDFIDQEVADRLKYYQVDIVELGVQSMVQQVLDQAGRGHKVEDIHRAVKILRDNKIGLGLQMMVGLPGDKMAYSKYTAQEFIKLRPDCVRIYPTLVVRDTMLEKMYLKGQYYPVDFNSSIEGISDILMGFQAEGINVIRIGLQATENMQLGKDIVAGPFHPSYGEFVQSKIYLKLMESILDGLDLSSQELKIMTNKKNISSMAGQKALNKKYLGHKYNLTQLSFIEDASMGDKDFSLEYMDRIYPVDYGESIKNYLNK